MIHVPNNVRYRFRDSDGDAQVIIGKRDYDKMIKKFSKLANISRSVAVQYLHATFMQEIMRTYGKPSKVTLVLDGTNIVLH